MSLRINAVDVSLPRQVERRAVAKHFGAEYLYCPDDCILGLQRDFDVKTLPLHGQRHPAIGGHTGWHVWAGDYLEGDDFFEPVCARHLIADAPFVDAYLGLGPGWRFLLAPGHVDVWYDAQLLDA